LTRIRLDGQRRPERASGPIDSTVLFVVITLVLIGVTLVYATTCHKGVAFLESQGLRAGLGLLVLLLGASLRYTVWNRKTACVILALSALALIATLVIGIAFKGVTRDLGSRGFSVQPAEFTKFGLLIGLAAYFEWVKEKGRDRSWRWGLGVPLAVVVAFIALTLKQPAVGTSIIIAASSLVLFVVAGVRWRQVFVTVAAGVVLFFVAITSIDYARDRWNEFVHGRHHQQEQSLIAIGSGGPVGRGLGESLQKFQFLPKMHNDFIFAEIGEEFGLIGSIAICLLYLLLFLYGMKISSEARTPFGQYLAAGISFIIFLYAVVHIAVALGLLPTTGQPLPFVSSGGSALLANLFAVGVLLNISRYRKTGTVVNLPPSSRNHAFYVGRPSGASRHKVLVLGGFGGKP